jgi:hypothetical protein
MYRKGFVYLFVLQVCVLAAVHDGWDRLLMDNG